MVVKLKYNNATSYYMDNLYFTRELKEYKNNFLLVSINYDSEAKKNNNENFKHYSCTMELHKKK